MEHRNYIIKTAEVNGTYVAMMPVWGGMVGRGVTNEKQAAGRYFAPRWKWHYN